ncbi:MAG: hypothetical protein C4326_04630 [Ignavibacteria bacterium]
MAKKLSDDLQEMLSRAKTDVAEPRRLDTLVQKERRYIYSGDPQEKIPGYAVRPSHKKVGAKRKVSTFNIVVALFAAAVVGVLYIGNLLAINQLNAEVNQLQLQYDTLVNTNKVLRAEINRKAAWERIGTIAVQQLGMMHPKERPEVLDVDAEKLEEFKQR